MTAAGWILAAIALVCAAVYRRERNLALEELDRALYCDHIDMFLDGEVEPLEVPHFRAHLAACEVCQVRVRDHAHLAAVVELMRTLPPAPSPN